LNAAVVTVRPVIPNDWPIISRIYAAGIATGNACFDTVVPSWAEWDRTHLAEHRLVAELDGEVVAWAALSPVSGRCFDVGVGEVSIYVDPAVQGQGVGSTLLAALVSGSERGGFWTVQAGIFPENTASIKLHQRCGFRVVGTRERIGQLNGVWRDSILLERRRRD
jgi:L-amino acid N-acyltransferase YncA